MRGIVIGGMVIGLLMGCNNGGAELEKKNSFYESVIKIGQGFQEIFGIFGNAMGETLGIVKSTDNRSVLGDHFDKVGKGLKSTKDKLDVLMRDITSAPNADTKGVEGVISSASEVLTKLIDSVGKLAKVTKEAGSINIANGAHANDATQADAGAAAADKPSVDAIIKEVKDIIDVAEKSGVKIEKREPGGQVTNGAGNAPAALVKSDARANANAGPKLAAEVAKADPWAMIDKIKSAKADGSSNLTGNTNEAGALATGTDSSGDDAGAATNADLAAAVALKAMSKDGKFTHAANESGAIKAAASNAVNKVLGILDEIIRRTVAKNLDKVREAIKGINYSETNGETTEVKK